MLLADFLGQNESAGVDVAQSGQEVNDQLVELQGQGVALDGGVDLGPGISPGAAEVGGALHGSQNILDFDLGAVVVVVLTDG